jgi:hypothetical protein
MGTIPEHLQSTHGTKSSSVCTITASVKLLNQRHIGASQGKLPLSRRVNSAKVLRLLGKNLSSSVSVYSRRRSLSENPV